jgi:hypothetical protein
MRSLGTTTAVREVVTFSAALLCAVLAILTSDSPASWLPNAIGPSSLFVVLASVVLTTYWLLSVSSFERRPRLAWAALALQAVSSFALIFPSQTLGLRVSQAKAVTVVVIAIIVGMSVGAFQAAHRRSKG